MKLKFTLALIISVSLIFSCEEKESIPSVSAPATYSFQRNGQSSISFTGQTNRIRMAEEIGAAFLDFNNTTEALLLEMFRNADAEGGDVSPFSESTLNGADQNIKSKVASSNVLFSANTAESAIIKADFENWIAGQIDEIFPYRNQLASAGSAGQLADGTSTRYVNAKGLEYNQAFTKSLIGALMMDQMVNHYLSKPVLDAGTNRTNNDEEITVEGKPYTTMEHYWDEAYGYLFGNASNLENPMTELGSSDGYLNRYLGRVDADEDFSGIAQEIYEALKLGRAAIAAKQYDLRDAQASIIQQKLSETIAIRAIYYLQQGKIALENEQYGTAFHDLSEGFGFIYSLRFTHNPLIGSSFFEKSEVDQMIENLYGSEHGFWDINGETLDAISENIAAKFDFTVTQAGN